MIAYGLSRVTDLDGYLADLIGKGLLQDQWAYSRLDAMFRPSVVAFLRRACGRDWLADEVANETFLRAYQSLSSFRGKNCRQFRSFLFAIAMNRLRDYCRSQARRPLTGSAELLRNATADCVEDKGNDVLEAKERSVVLRKALADLEPDQAKLICLAHFKGLKAQQIAKMMGKPSPQAVRSALCRAMKDLRALLQRQGYFE